MSNYQVMFMEKRCLIWHSAAGGMSNFVEFDGTNNMEEGKNAGLCVAQELRHFFQFALVIAKTVKT
jgi:hypothetical protein